MRFLTRYTPASPESRRSPEQMAAMGGFVEACIKSGVLIATGGIVPSVANSMRIRLSDGAYCVTADSSSKAQQAGGWAILEVNSTEHLEQVARDFLKAAGEGDVEVLQITQMPLQ